MAKRKKTRTHLNSAGTSQSPKSFVIRSTRTLHAGAASVGSAPPRTRTAHPCSSLNRLVKDFRKVLEPNTASKIRERKSNRLKDFLAMAGPLDVTHIIVFSQSSVIYEEENRHITEEEVISNINMKIYRAPRGPTLTFKVLRYSLMVDILNCERQPRSPGSEYKTEPLLIMNNFNPHPQATKDEAEQLNLLTTTFRNMFPQIKVHTIQLVQTRRVVLLSYNPQTRTIDFRHYVIIVKPIGVTKTLQRLMRGVTVSNEESQASNHPLRIKKKKKRILDLSRVEDVSEYVLGKAKVRGPPSAASSGAFTGDQSDMVVMDEQSECSGLSSGGEDESEVEDEHRKIDLPQNYLGRGNLKNTKRAIKLKEIGPRMELGLVKIEQGLGNGDVLYHELIKKSKEEASKIKKTVKEKAKQKAERKKVQEENVKRKRLEKETKLKLKKQKVNGKAAEGEDGKAEQGEVGEEGSEGSEEGSSGNESEDGGGEYSDLIDDGSGDDSPFFDSEGDHHLTESSIDDCGSPHKSQGDATDSRTTRPLPKPVKNKKKVKFSL